MTSSENVVLTVRMMPARQNGGAADVTRFVRYVQFRDIHPDSVEAKDVDGLLAYVHHRDPTSPRGRMFDANGAAGDEERRLLVDHVGRSNAELLLRPNPSRTSLRAAYRLIISPEDARGLNLQRLARSAMARLGNDSGGELPPWIAGEHRNTRHPHVHIVLAARRETAPGQFRTLVITRDRLAAMKAALIDEMTLEREAHHQLSGAALRAAEAENKSRPLPDQSPSPSMRAINVDPVAGESITLRSPASRSSTHAGPPAIGVASLAGRMSRYHQREALRLARQRRVQRDEEDRDPRTRSWRR